jgi:hypothetical protein
MILSALPVIQRVIFFHQLAKRRLLSEGIWLTFLNATTEEAFGNANVPFNSFVVVATQKIQREVLLEEVYRVAPHLPLKTRRVGTWDSMAGRLFWTRQPVRTSNLRGLTIKAATIHVSLSCKHHGPHDAL